MPYPKKPVLDHYQLELHQIDSLKPGESLPLTGTSEAIESIRYAIYSYLHHFRIKHLYKLNRVNPELLIVTRKPKHTVQIAYEGVHPEVKEFVSKYLLHITEEDEALALIRDHLEKSLWLSAADEWRRIQESGEAKELH